MEKITKITDDDDNYDYDYNGHTNPPSLYISHFIVDLSFGLMLCICVFVFLVFLCVFGWYFSFLFAPSLKVFLCVFGIFVFVPSTKYHC